MTHGNEGQTSEQKLPPERPERQPAAPWQRHAVIALLAAAVLAGGLVAGTAAVDDLSMAMRCATALAMPIGALWLFFFVAAVWLGLRRQRTGAAVFAALFLALGILGNGRFASWLMQHTEWPLREAALLEETTTAPDTQPFRAVVVLGGSVSVRPDGVVELNRDGERVFSAAQAWHAGQSRAIICTGTAVGPLPDPSQRSRRLLESVGVPAEAIFEVPGVNTTNEMRGLNEFFADPPPEFPGDGRLGLITSAFHMPRAMRLAGDQGLSFVPLPCAYRAGKSRPFSPYALVPSAVALADVSTAAKEWLAWVVGR